MSIPTAETAPGLVVAATLRIDAGGRRHWFPTWGLAARRLPNGYTLREPFTGEITVRHRTELEVPVRPVAPPTADVRAVFPTIDDRAVRFISGTAPRRGRHWGTA